MKHFNTLDRYELLKNIPQIKLKKANKCASGIKSQNNAAEVSNVKTVLLEKKSCRTS